MTDASALVRFIYSLFLPVAYKVADTRLAHKKLSWLWRLLYFFAYWTVLRALRDKLGLLRARCAYTGGEAVSPDVLRYIRAIGVNIRQLYGGSETGLVALQRSGDVKLGTCGEVLTGAELRLSEAGEILVRGDKMFIGYYKNSRATRENVRGGWFHSGDFGNVDKDGQLVVIDRMADLKELGDGRKFSPQYIEVRLRFSPYIRDAMVVGGTDKTYVTALIGIDPDNFGHWADKSHIAYSTLADLSQKPEIIRLVAVEVQKLNEALPEWTRIRKFINLHKEFDPDEAELTRTRKLRREFIEDRYRYMIDALYSDRHEIMVETPVIYRDGRQGVTKTTVMITNLDEG
jgi:long-chain acyl-CoA synthetase